MGSKSSPYQASRVVKYHLEKIISTSDNEQEVRCAKILLKTLYVDDAILAFKNETEAIEARKTITQIFHSMGMKLGKFSSTLLQFHCSRDQ